MTMQEFIGANREAIDVIIRGASGIGPDYPIDDDKRENWIINDEGLYDWARSEGVDV